MEAGREFQFLEVIETNVLANEVVRHFSNLTAKECWESAKRALRANFIYRRKKCRQKWKLFQNCEHSKKILLHWRFFINKLLVIEKKIGTQTWFINRTWAPDFHSERYYVQRSSNYLIDFFGFSRFLINKLLI